MIQKQIPTRLSHEECVGTGGRCIWWPANVLLSLLDATVDVYYRVAIEILWHFLLAIPRGPRGHPATTQRTGIGNLVGSALDSVGFGTVIWVRAGHYGTAQEYHGQFRARGVMV